MSQDGRPPEQAKAEVVPARAPAYEFAASSFGEGVLGGGAGAGELFGETGAHLLGALEEDEDSSQWEPPANSGGPEDWLQQLWMDSLIDDLADTLVQTTTAPPPPPRPKSDAVDALPSTPCPSELCRGGHDASPPSEDRSDCTATATGGTTGGATATVAAAAAAEEEDSSSLREGRREVGQELVNLLLACAEAVSTKSLSLVNPLFAQLGELASPEGTAMQRIAAYFTEGLATRCARLWPHIYRPLPCPLDLSDEDSLAAFHILNHVSPYVKFAHFTANDIILHAFEGASRVHVIDFDIKQGLQWPALFQSLAARAGGPPAHVRVTGVGEYKEDVQDTGDRLAEFADALDLPFEFHAVIDKLEDVRLWMLHVKEKEAVAVNCVFQLHRTLHDSENGVRDFLAMIRSTRPRVVAIVEQEACHNGQFFEGRSPRFLEALQYYAAIFDSLDLNMPVKSGARMKVEQLFAREIRNILACEGAERVERHEGIETWRVHLHQAGFRSAPLTKRVKTQARLLLEMFACKSYTIKEDGSALTLGWRTRPLFTASAWAPEPSD